MALFYSSRHGRSYMNCSIEYVLDPFNADETYEGIIENISESGFCLITPTPLKEGQEIMIKSLIYLPSQTATVCWVKQEDDVYRVGLKFTS